MSTSYPLDGILHLGRIQGNVGVRVEMLGSSGDLGWVSASPGMRVTLPQIQSNPSKWAWTLAITNV